MMNGNERYLSMRNVCVQTSAAYRLAEDVNVIDDKGIGVGNRVESLLDRYRRDGRR